MRIRPVGATAAIIDVPAGSSARWRRALVDLVAAGGLAAPDEIVPGWSTVLIDGCSAAALANAVDHLVLSTDAAPNQHDRVEIPAVYDGADLAEVARAWRTDAATVVKRHTAADFEVAFCGFAPGFAYLVGLDDAVPRRATPRTRVPAGAVALAGRFCGIYPAASPGGWQIIGRTSVPLFNVGGDPPALLPPGTRVRFVSVDSQPEPVPPRQPTRVDGPPGLTVVRAGTLSTVQDGGRLGSAHLGVPRAGALDQPAARLGNRLVGNRADAALIETTHDGVAFRVERSTTVAVTGAVAPVHVDGRSADWGNSVSVLAGSLVEVGTAILGLRSYVAISGGVDVTPVLGSRSTDTLSHLGPPALTSGQVLDIGAAAQPVSPVPFTVPRPVGEVTLRLRVGPDDDWFSGESIDLLTSAAYTLSSESNRVGARLHGPPIAWLATNEMDSAGLVVGAVQVPPDGQPVVLLADHPTTGGYPVIGVVEPADLAALAQARPGPQSACAGSEPDMSAVIDLNCDLGEGFGVWRLGDDQALLGIVTSANAACGFHAGDPSIMRAVATGAVEHGVAIGAQVAYRDLAGFGRRHMDIAPDELTNDVVYQLGALDGLCRVAGTRVRYVKPHGALYNACVDDEQQARAVARAVAEYDDALPLLGLPGSALLRAAEALGLTTVSEGFADRGYTPDGHLVPRSEPGALVTDPEVVVERSVRMVTAGEVVAVDGSVLAMPVSSLCLHGDTPGAAELARQVRRALEAAGVDVQPFAD